tara:strand:+ start:681 stop:929 length:249 start_codon:yes stop_codon:yes gene_type:complete
MTWLASILLLSVGAGLWRAWRGPTQADRLMAVQLFGTSGAAILMLLAQAQNLPALLNAALVLALLAAVVCAALVQLLREPHD